MKAKISKSLRRILDDPNGSRDLMDYVVRNVVRAPVAGRTGVTVNPPNNGKRIKIVDGTYLVRSGPAVRDKSKASA